MSLIKYRALMEEGYEIALALCNAMTLANSLEMASSINWGVFEHNCLVQTRSRLKAWKRVEKLRMELYNLVTVEMNKCGYDEDLALRRQILQLLCSKADLAQEESLALLALWTSSPFL
jgi:hypothetical protein